METGEWSKRERIGGRRGFLFSSSPPPFIPLFYSRANFLELAPKRLPCSYTFFNFTGHLQCQVYQ